MTLTPEQFEKLKAQLATQQVAGLKTGFLSDTMSDIKQTGANIRQTFLSTRDRQAEALDAGVQGRQSLPRSLAQAVGIGAGGLSRAVGDVVTGAVKTVLPQSGEDAVKSGLGAAIAPIAEKVMDTGLVKEIVSGYEAMDDASKRDVDAKLGIVSLASEFIGLGLGKRAASGVIRGTGKATSSLGKTVGSATDATTERIKRFVGVGTPEDPFREALDLTMPTLKKKEAIGAFERAGKPGGVSVAEGKTGQFKYTPTEYDQRVARTAEPFISGRKNVVERISALNNEINRFSEVDVGGYLKANPRAVNVARVESRLREIEVPDLFKADPILERTYDLVRNRMLRRIRESGG